MGQSLPLLILEDVVASQICEGLFLQIHRGLKSSSPKGFVFHGLTGLSGCHSSAKVGYFHAREPMILPQWGHRFFSRFSRSRTVSLQRPPQAMHSQMTFLFEPDLTFSGVYLSPSSAWYHSAANSGLVGCGKEWICDAWSARPKVETRSLVEMSDVWHEL